MAVKCNAADASYGHPPRTKTFCRALIPCDLQSTCEVMNMSCPAVASPLLETTPSNSAAVVCPMQKSLALALTTRQVARFAMSLNLRNMPPHRLPAGDLPLILLRQAATHIVAAIPLKPPARVVGVNPARAPPD